MKITKEGEKMIRLITGIVAVCMLVCGCDVRNKVEETWFPNMPKTATNKKVLGSGWYTFTYEGERFLLFRTGHKIAITHIQESRGRNVYTATQ